MSKYSINDINEYLHSGKGELYYDKEQIIISGNNFYNSVISKRINGFGFGSIVGHLIEFPSHVTHDKEGKIHFNPEYVEWIPKFNVGDIVRYITTGTIFQVEMVRKEDREYIGRGQIFIEKYLELVCKAENREDLK